MLNDVLLELILSLFSACRHPKVLAQCESQSNYRSEQRRQRMKALLGGLSVSLLIVSCIHRFFIGFKRQKNDEERWTRSGLRPARF